MALQTLLGVESLVAHQGKTVSVSSLEGKIVLLYFSAHWCPPCRGFTPVLAKTYNTLKAAGKDFEIIFVSSDRSQSDFDEYFKEHPWIALPYSERKAKEKLSKKLKVNGIPTLALINEKGEVVSTKVRNDVAQDPQGKNFPWIPKTISEILAGASLVSRDASRTLNFANIQTPFALYFSAHWCPPCRGFTPVLAKTYESMKARGVNFEIIFVTGDNSEEEFNEYLREMPWYALPHGSELIDQLNSACGVEGIPSLVTVSASGQIITDEGREAVSADPEGHNFPWVPKPLPLVSPMDPSGKVIEALNSDVVAVLALHGSDGAAALDGFTHAAEKCDAALKSSGVDPVRFFVVHEGAADQRGLFEKVVSVLGAKVKAGSSSLIVFNLPNNKAHTVVQGELTADKIGSEVLAFAKSQA